MLGAILLLLPADGIGDPKDPLVLLASNVPRFLGVEDHLVGFYVPRLQLSFEGPFEDRAEIPQGYLDDGGSFRAATM